MIEPSREGRGSRTTTVFLSSTGRDLSEYREVVYHAIEALDGYHCMRMEDFGARDSDPDTFCHTAVSTCDLFVCLVGHFYGSCPKGEQTSYTEREYDTAVALGKPRLVFLAPDDFPIPADLIGSDKHRRRQRQFRRRASSDDRLWTVFSSPHHLAWLAVVAIHNWADGHAGALLAGLDAFAGTVRSWLDACGYRFELQGLQRYQWVIVSSSAGIYERIMVRVTDTAPAATDFASLRESARREQVDAVWLVVPDHLSGQLSPTSCLGGPERTVCYTLDELVDKHVDFGHYLTWVDGEVVARGVANRYVNLSCSRSEYDSAGMTRISEVHYPEATGGIDGYADSWMGDQDRNLLAVLGGFGTGKTWFALHYTHLLAARVAETKDSPAGRPRLPLYVPLIELSGSLDLRSVIRHCIERYKIRVAAEGSVECLDRMGRLVFILDGLDELAGALSADKVSALLTQLVRSMSAASKVIVTCRLESVPATVALARVPRVFGGDASDPTAAKHKHGECVELSSFTDKQIQELAERSRSDPGMIERVLESRDLADLARRPILCDLILEALPEVRPSALLDTARVFLHAIRRKLEQDLRAKRSAMSVAEKLYFLCELSWQLLRDSTAALAYEQFPDHLRHPLGVADIPTTDSDLWLHEVMVQSMLIPDSAGRFAPAHRSLSEFLAAYKLTAELGVQSGDYVDLARSHSHIDPSYSIQPYTWSQYFTRLSEAKQHHVPMAALGSFDTEDYTNAAVLKRVVTVGSLSQNALLLAAQMVDPDPARIGRLCELSIDRSDTLAWNALALLPLMGKGVSAVFARTLIDKSGDAPLRSGVTWVLGELGVTGAYVQDALMRTIRAGRVRNGTTSSAWWEAAFALAKLQLGRCQSTRTSEIALPLLIEHLPPWLTLDDALQHIEKCLAERDAQIVEGLEFDLVTLIKYDIARARPDRLARLLSATDFGKDTCRRRCYYIVWLCGHLRLTESVPALLEATGSPLNSVRGIAFEALGKVGVTTPPVLESLRRGLSDRYYRARYHAATALGLLSEQTGHFARRQSIRYLAEAIRSEDVLSTRDQMGRVLDALARMQ